jgi:hypothetical protein
MSDVKLIAYIGGRCRLEVAELAREGASFDKHLYRVRLKVAKQHLEWRGLWMPPRKTTLKAVPCGRSTASPREPEGINAAATIANLFRLRDKRTTQTPMFQQLEGAP